MKLQQQPAEALHDHLVEVVGIGGLVLFGVMMVFLGWRGQGRLPRQGDIMHERAFRSNERPARRESHGPSA